MTAAVRGTSRSPTERARSPSGPHADPTLVVVASAENWLKVVAGSLDPQLAFLTGRLKVRGDMGLAMRLRALFL